MKALRIAICTLLAFGVLAHGGVEDWALAVFETSAGVLFFLWALFFALHREEEIVFPSVLAPLVAFACVVAAQLLLRRTASAWRRLSRGAVNFDCSRFFKRPAAINA